MRACLCVLFPGSFVFLLSERVAASTRSQCPHDETEREEHDGVALLQQFLGSVKSEQAASLDTATQSTPISGTSAPRPHIIFMMGDDLGWYDQAITGLQSEASKYKTHNLTQLARDGMRLNYHYAHYQCSPARRSFLTGRTALHHGDFLSRVETDDIDLRWTWISEKLTQAGYVSHFYGKGHTGYKSMMHMPANRGFKGGSVLYLDGGIGKTYYTLQYWNGTSLLFNKSSNPQIYSTDLFGELSVRAIENHDPSVPLFLYLPWQAPHVPESYPTFCKQMGGTEDCDNRVLDCMHSVDIWTGRIIDALRKRDMYSNSLLVFTSDHGGLGTVKGGGNNYPLRGQKGTNWQGGLRVVTFISGGFIPDHIRGTEHNGTFHISDWYPTFCRLAGVDGSDDPPVAPLPIDQSNPSKDIYGDDSYPPVDGIDIWDALVSHSPSAHQYLSLSAEVVIKDGRYKLVTAQPTLVTIDFFSPQTGWREPDGSWIKEVALDGDACGVAFLQREHLKPCLFDLLHDEREEHDLSARMPELVSEMWNELNRSSLTAFTSRSPRHLLGRCHEICAKAHWASIWGEEIDGPICGVAACG